MKTLALLLAGLTAVNAVGCIANSVPKTPSHGGPAWLEVATDHFLIDTDFEPQAAFALASQLENLRKVMISLMYAGEPTRPSKLRVLALRNDEYRQYTTRYSGVFLSNGLFEPLLVTSPGSDAGIEENRVRVHELGHYVSSLYVATDHQPRWFSEGFAGVMETLKYDPPSGAVEFGQPPMGYDDLGLAHPVWLDELWNWHDDQQLTPAGIAQYYEASWAVVHWLLDERAEQTFEFMMQLRNGRPPRDAWATVFGIDEHEMAEHVGKHWGARKKSVVRADATEHDARPLGDADVLAIRAMLHMALPGTRSRDEARRLASDNLARAKQVDPANFLTNAVSYRYFDKLPDSLAIANSVAMSQEDNWLAWVMYGQTLAAHKGPLSEERDALQRAIAVSPNSRMALIRASDAELRARNWASAVDLAYRALLIRPPSIDAAGTYVIALAHASRCEEARKLLRDLQHAHENASNDDVDRTATVVLAVCQSGSGPASDSGQLGR